MEVEGASSNFSYSNTLSERESRKMTFVCMFHNLSRSNINKINCLQKIFDELESTLGCVDRPSESSDPDARLDSWDAPLSSSSKQSPKCAENSISTQTP